MLHMQHVYNSNKNEEIHKWNNNNNENQSLSDTRSPSSRVQCALYINICVCSMQTWNSGWILYALIWTFTWIYVCVHRVLIVFFCFVFFHSRLFNSVSSLMEIEIQTTLYSFIINSPTMVAIADRVFLSLTHSCTLSPSFLLVRSRSLFKSEKFMAFRKQK